MEENFKLRARNKNSTLVVAFVLISSEPDRAIKEYGGKKGIIYLYSI